MWSTPKQENEMKARLFYTILRHPQGKEKEIEKKERKEIQNKCDASAFAILIK